MVSAASGTHLQSYFLDVTENMNYGANTYAHNMDTSPKSLPVTTPVIAVDDLDIGDVHLIKIDIEGMEFKALVGAEKTISRCKPAIFFEKRDEETLSKARAILDHYGYRYLEIVSSPFNAMNYRGGANNIFGESFEVNVLAISENQPPLGFLGETEANSGTHYVVELQNDSYPCHGEEGSIAESAPYSLAQEYFQAIKKLNEQ